MQHSEAHKERGDSAKTGSAESEIITVIYISNHLQNLPGYEIKHNPNHLTLSGPT